MQTYDDPDGPMGLTEEESRQANIASDSMIKRSITMMTMAIIMVISWVITGPQK